MATVSPCSTCRYFTMKTQHTGFRSGFCQRYPPVANDIERYPAISNDTTEGCGEHAT